MDTSLTLLMSKTDFSKMKGTDLQLLSKTANNDLVSRLIMIQTVGKMLCSAVQDSTFGAFTDVGDLELFGIMVSSLGEEAQTLGDLMTELNLEAQDRVKKGADHV